MEFKAGDRVHVTKLDYYGPVAIVLSFVIAQFVDLKKEVSKK